MSRYSGSKKEAIIAAWRTNPKAPKKDIAEATGAAIVTVKCVISQERQLDRYRAIHEAEKADAAKQLNALFASGDRDAIATRSFEMIQRQSLSEAYRKMDMAAINGEGLTLGWEDADVLQLLEGICSVVLQQFSDLGTLKSQAVWDTRARAISLFANFIASDVVPLARRGNYRGFEGDEFFLRLAGYMKKRVAAGVLG